MQDAGLVEPTQPTSMAPDTLRIQKACSRLAPLLQGQRLGCHHVATAKPASHMPADHRQRFLQLALDAEALRYGPFTLKSGRVSPYFFHAGHFDSGETLAALAGCYADAIDAAGLDFDLPFGPAYQGIPLATALAREYLRRGPALTVAFNRKRAKDHRGGGGTGRWMEREGQDM